MRQSVAPARDLFHRVGNPDAALRCVLVAGTKGKGSVVSLVAAALRRDGLREAIYASPHVERIQERVRIAGREVQDDALAAALEEALAARERAVHDATPAADATWFDVLTVAALCAMRDAGVEWAVLECGLGGRLDSTNAIEPEVCAITSIALEHTAILGTTHAAIAREKAGIARAGRALVSGVEPASEAGLAIADAAREVGARLVVVPANTGSIERRNRALADALLAEMGCAPTDAAAVRAAHLPGRLERGRVEGVPVILDGAHVADSLELVVGELTGPGAPLAPPKKMAVVFGAGADKDAARLLKVLVGRVDRVLCTSLGPGPYAPADRLRGIAATLGLVADSVPDPEVALHMAIERSRLNGWVLVTGSLHLVGRLRHLVTIDGPSTEISSR